MKIILHIGTFKTGSTALQHHLAKNADFLSDQNYFYGDYFDVIKAHSNLTYGLLKNALIEHKIFDDYSQHPRFINVAEEPQAVIERIIDDSKGKDIVISSEALYADSYRTLIGLDADEQKRRFDAQINSSIRESIYKLLSRYSSDITVVCYLRRQDFWIESQYNQVNKVPWYTGHKPLGFNNFIKSNPIHLNYEKELLEWGKWFGNKNIIIRLYEEPLLTYGLIRDFYESILGVDGFEKTEDVDRTESNIGLEPIFVEYIKKLGIYNTRISKFFLETEKLSGRYNKCDGFFSPEERKAFLETFRECNRNTALLFFDREELFIEDYEETKEIEEIGYDKFVEITRQLITNLLDEKHGK